MARDDVVTRGATPGVFRRRASTAASYSEPAAYSEPASALRLVVPDEEKFRWRRAGFARAPVTLVIDVTAALVAALLLSLSSLSCLLLLVLVLTLNYVGGHYRASIAPSLLDELPSLVGRALVAGAVATAMREFMDVPVHNGLIGAAVLFLAVAVAGRMVAYPLVRVYRRGGGRGDPTLIIGCGTIGAKVAATLLDRPEYGLWPVGYVDDKPRIEFDDRRIPVLGGLRHLPELLRANRISNVIVAFTDSPEKTLVEALRTCDRMSCEIFFVPRLHELHGSGHATEMLWDIPLTRLSRASYRTVMWRTKRGFDLVISALALVLLTPVLLACAIAVRLETGPGVIYRQERVGLDGRRFQILKFRTIRPRDGEAPGETDSQWSIGGDPRIGPVGRIMRKLSLDELPQLWNILRGDMSLVGPRPERPTFVDAFSRQFPRYVARHRVPAGLTGWAQVHGLRGDTDIADRVAFDNYYIENWSMWSDVKIILRTFGQVAGGRGR